MGGVGKMLTKEQMRKVVGGDYGSGTCHFHAKVMVDIYSGAVFNIQHTFIGNDNKKLTLNVCY